MNDPLIGVLCVPAEIPDDMIGAGLAYTDAGWYVLPIDQGSKHAGSVLGRGWPGKSSQDPHQIADWFAGTDYGLALHVGRSGAVAFDVDNPDQLPDDLSQYLAHEDVPYQSTRVAEPRRGHYLCAVPGSIGNSTGDFGKGWGEVRGSNGIIVVAPTRHEKEKIGGRYHWERTGVLPMLPAELAAKLREPLSSESVVSNAEIGRWIVAHPTGTRRGGLVPILNKYRTEAAIGSRHDTLVACLTWACKEVDAGLLSAPEVIETLGAMHTASLADTAHPNGARPGRGDFTGALAWAIAQARVSPYVDHSAPPHATGATPPPPADSAPPPPPPPPPPSSGGSLFDEPVGPPMDGPPPAAPPPTGGSLFDEPVGPPTDGAATAAATPAPVNPSRPTAYTESALSEAFAALVSGSWNWCPELGWQHWNGTHWQSRSVEDAVEAARVYLRQLWVDATLALAIAVASGADEHELKTLSAVANTCRTLQSKAKGEAIAKYVRGQPAIRVEAEAFDSNPELLNCGNGMVNLRTGELLPHDPAMLLRKFTEVNYRPDAIHDDWQSALGAVVDDETRRWLRVLFGAAASGYTFDEDIVPFNYGEGENGKSTVLGGVQMCLGSYSTLIMPKLLGGQGSDHETYMMALLGTRLAYLEELPRGHVLDMAKIKQISGTAEITGRFLYQNQLTFRATHLLMVNTNYPPVVTDVDHGTWRRLLSIPWPADFKEESGHRDKGLRERVHTGVAQQEAVLAWVVGGAMEWLQAGRNSPPIPQACVKHTQEWRHDNDTIGSFLAKNVVDADAQDPPLLVTELMEKFNEAQGRGAPPWQIRTFVARLRNHPYLLDRHLQVVKRTAAPHKDQLVVHGLKFANRRYWHAPEFHSEARSG